MKYSELKRKQITELEEFPIAFAFNNKQLEDALTKLDAKAEECVSIGGGSIIKREDLPNLEAMQQRHQEEMNEAFENDEFLTDAIRYELGNHEYCITYDARDALSALGIRIDDARKKRCYQKAKSEYLEGVESW